MPMKNTFKIVHLAFHKDKLQPSTHHAKFKYFEVGW